MIGGIYGLAFLAKVVMLFLVMAGAVSFVKLIKKGALVSRIKAFIYYILHIGIIKDRYYNMERDGTEFAICLAPVIAAAYFITLFFMEMRQLDMAMGIDKTGNQCAFGDMLRAITLPDADNPAVTIIIFNEPVPYRCGFQGIYKRCRYPFYRQIGRAHV